MRLSVTTLQKKKETTRFIPDDLYCGSKIRVSYSSLKETFKEYCAHKKVNISGDICKSKAVKEFYKENYHFYEFTIKRNPPCPCCAEFE